MSNNNNGLWLALVGVGVIADRPQTPNVPKGVGAFWIATDTGAITSWNGAAWTELGAGTIQTGLVASVTQTRAGALQLSGSYANVSTVGTAGDAVKLPAATPGAKIWVTNSAGANAMGVFPQAAADVIDGGAAGAKVTVSAGKSALFTCIAAGVWQSIGSAARAA